MGKNIAFCFYGQVRLPHLIENFYSKWNEIQNDYKFDFYLSTWNDFTNTEIFSYFTKTEYVKFSKTFLPKNKGNTRKMAYLLKSVNKLLNESEKKYDYVIYTRTDVLFKLDSIIKLFNENWDEITNDENTVITLSEIYEKDGYGYLDSDIGFLSTIKGFNEHAQLYNYFFGVDSEDKSKKEGGHFSHGIFLNKKVSSVICKKLEHTLIRPTRDINILNITNDYDELIDGIVKNIEKSKSVSHLGFSNDYIQLEDRIVNFKESIIE